MYLLILILEEHGLINIKIRLNLYASPIAFLHLLIFKYLQL
jgi:hypothetical protein